MQVIFMLHVLHSFLLDFVALNKFQGRRGWSKGPLTTEAVARSMPTFSWPSPCEEKQTRSREMTLENEQRKRKKKGQLTIK